MPPLRNSTNSPNCSALRRRIGESRATAGDGYRGADIRTPIGSFPLPNTRGHPERSGGPERGTLWIDLVKLLIPRQGPIAHRRLAAPEARPLKERAMRTAGRPPNGRRSAE